MTLLDAMAIFHLFFWPSVLGVIWYFTSLNFTLRLILWVFVAICVVAFAYYIVLFVILAFMFGIMMWAWF